MIRAINGKLEGIGPDWVLIGLGNITLQISVPPAAIQSFGPIGSTIKLHTHLSIRDDGMTLYGFKRPEELRIFELLIGVTGIGPKLGLTILSNVDVDHFVTTILTQNMNNLNAIPGIGKKTAGRLLLELKGKLDGAWVEALTTAQETGSSEVISALVALGYSPSEARIVVSKLPTSESKSVEELVLLALQGLGQ
jgi:Holliday junction DNA helicase RuvA